jgi:hypothetical protein
MKKNSPYVLFPREIWDSAVVFADMVNLDVYMVISNAVLEHIHVYSGAWSEEQQEEFVQRIEEMKRQHEECQGVDRLE